MSRKLTLAQEASLRVPPGEPPLTEKQIAAIRASWDDPNWDHPAYIPQFEMDAFMEELEENLDEKPNWDEEELEHERPKWDEDLEL